MGSKAQRLVGSPQEALCRVCSEWIHCGVELEVEVSPVAGCETPKHQCDRRDRQTDFRREVSGRA